MTVLVTGATGFVGGHLVEALARQGTAVRALVRPGGDAAAVERLRTAGAELRSGDVTEPAAVAAAARGCEVVYHLAVPRGRGRPSKTEHRAVTVTGTANVLRAALDAGVAHVVFCSTGGVSGPFRGTPLLEAPPAPTANPYHAAKARAEALVVEAARRDRLSVVIARLTAVYGPRDLRWLRLFHDALGGRPLLPAGGRVPYHLTEVEDAVRGLLLCGDLRRAAAPCYHIGADPVPTLRDVVDAVASAGGARVRPREVPAGPIRAAVRAARLLRPLGFEPRFVHKAETFAAGRAYDVSRALRELEFTSRVGLREGVRRLLAWYVEQGHLALAAGAPAGGATDNAVGDGPTADAERRPGRDAAPGR